MEEKENSTLLSVLERKLSEESYVCSQQLCQQSNQMLQLFTDAIAGWSLVAMYFCKLKQYSTALQLIGGILQEGAKENKLLLAFVDIKDMVRYFTVKADTRWHRRQSFLQRTKNLCIDLIYQTPTSSWLFEELLIDTGFQCWRVHPLVFAHFLHFVIFNRTGIITRDRALRYIIIPNLESRIPGFYRERLTTFILLTIACK
ncbi:unnamed protein product [Mytilus coruscus]|uniref:Uncharacterized protein n=1 Tax=Mytilus coruscus TaxID=42192 RepID=A0A6J8DQU3_MYTCO|nr:unnamed protein product [Mytilus coruscus]